MAHYLGKRLENCTAKRNQTEKVYQLNAEQTLFLGGLARFDYVQGAKSSFIDVPMT